MRGKTADEWSNMVNSYVSLRAVVLKQARQIISQGNGKDFTLLSWDITHEAKNKI